MNLPTYEALLLQSQMPQKMSNPQLIGALQMQVLHDSYLQRVYFNIEQHPFNAEQI